MRTNRIMRRSRTFSIALGVLGNNLPTARLLSSMKEIPEIKMDGCCGNRTFVFGQRYASPTTAADNQKDFLRNSFQVSALRLRGIGDSVSQ